MDKDIAKILEQTGLPTELVDKVQEAFDAKMVAARSDIEQSVRGEMAARFEHDKNTLVEAMDKMLTDALSSQEKTKAEEINKLSETRVKFEKAISVAKQEYQKKLTENLNKASEFVGAKVDAEIMALRETKSALNSSKKHIVSESKKLMEAEKVAFGKKLKQIDQFVVEQLTRELQGVTEDHKLLIKTRAKLIQENESQLKATKTAFVKEAASKVDAVITESLKAEITQLHEEIERSRENMFGRKMFEAFVAEYMGSYFAEGSEVKKLQSMLESTKQELANAKSKISEAQSKVDAENRKAKLAEQNTVRERKMNKLLNTLSGVNKSTMGGLLETVKTENLEEAFHKYLPIITESRKSEVKPKSAPSTTTITGDERSALKESASTEVDNEANPELDQIVRLAGIRR